MKKILSSLIFLVCFHLTAQNFSDVLKYSQTSLNGSARYTALGGAFGAVGGDLSALEANPAGSSIFSFSELGFTLNSSRLSNDVTYFDSTNKNSDHRINFNHFGIVLVLGEENYGKWSKLALAFNYQKHSDFNANYFIEGYNRNNGIDRYFLDYAQGRFFENISQMDNESFSEAYLAIGETEDLGFPAQQALIGYEAYMINPVPFSETSNPTDPNIQSYRSNTQAGPNGFYHDYTLLKSGSSRKYTFNISSVYDNKLYLGLNINSYNVKYSEYVDFYESDYGSMSGVQSFLFLNDLKTMGSGKSFQLGAIYKVSNYLRLGLTFDSPTYYRLYDQLYQTAEVEAIEDERLISRVLDPEASILFPEYRLNTPYSTKGSLAYIIKDRGFISIDFTQKNYLDSRFSPREDAFLSYLNEEINNQFQTSKIIQIGGEYRLNPELSLRAGYFNETASLVGFDNSQSFISGGFGYNLGPSQIDMSLQAFTSSKERPLFSNGLTDTIEINQNRLNLILTYRLKL